ncbi:MAG: A/G-specific adenine glycosylase [Saprospiraceae bacterium]|nr:A/G-specific adenine glycosylase [Saprospiraceae bacterium]
MNSLTKVDYPGITRKILDWHASHPRLLPWKGQGPYATLLSEIILQQTRVEQGLPYYDRFIRLFPTIEALAKASEDDVLHAWQGLGYYSRARNLHLMAKIIANDLNGEFPSTYDGWLRMKGIGPYTAAAIASFAFDEPCAVLDGNVYRVLSRLFTPEADFYTNQGRRDYQKLADQLLPRDQSATFNQAIMDFGALQCVPKLPDCNCCPLTGVCQAYQQHRTDQFPPAKPKLSKRTRYFHYLVPVDREGYTWIEQRRQKDIWQRLYQFPLKECTHSGDSTVLQKDFLKEHQLLDWISNEESKDYKHILSHQVIQTRFHVLTGDRLPEQPAFRRVKIKNLPKFAFPKVVHCYLMDYSIYLNTIHHKNG